MSFFHKGIEKPRSLLGVMVSIKIINKTPNSHINPNDILPTNIITIQLNPY